jgi:hypothetical protein
MLDMMKGIADELKKKNEEDEKFRDELKKKNEEDEKFRDDVRKELGSLKEKLQDGQEAMQAKQDALQAKQDALRAEMRAATAKRKCWVADAYLILLRTDLPRSTKNNWWIPVHDHRDHDRRA